MFLLILGLLLWFYSHLMKRLTPGLRANLGEDRGKGVVALMSLIAVVLMVIGYRMAEIIPVYRPIPYAGHAVSLFMLIAVLMFGAGSKGSWLATRMRHPMLTATKLWALSHLLVNGDLASILLFRGILAWAVVSVILINRANPDYEKPARTSPGKRDLILVVVWAAIYGLITGVHIWLGHNPFIGTYT